MLIFLVMGERNSCLIQQTGEFVEHGDYLLRIFARWRFRLSGLRISRAGKRSAPAKVMLIKRYGAAFPAFFSHTSKIEIAAGVTPEMRDA